MHELRPDPELPFLIVHGAVVWKVLLVILVIASLAALALVRMWISRRRAREQVNAKIQAARSSSSGDVTLFGELSEGSAVTFSRGDVEASSRSEKLCLLVEGERIDLVGDVRVEHGSREQSTWFRIPRELPSNLDGRPGRCASMITRSVAKGDRVIVTASQGRQTDENAGYREQGVQRILEGTGGPIVISAQHPAGKRYSLGLVWLLPLVVFSTIWGLALRKVGSVALERVGEVTELAQLEGLSAASIAAAMPGSRDTLVKQLERSPSEIRSDEALDLKLALAAYFGECPYYTLFRLGRFEEALAAARRCGSLGSVATALLYLGRFAEAAPLVSPRGDQWYIATMVAIATGDWERAAIGAERRAVSHSRRDRHQYYTDADATRFATQARCLAALFRFYAGEQGTFANIPNREGNVQCAMLEALTLPDAQQAETLGSMTVEDTSERLQAGALWRAAGGAATTLDWVSSALLHGLGNDPWFGRIAAKAYSGTDPEALRLFDYELAIVSVIHGDFNGAREHLRRGIEHGLSPYHAQYLEMQIALREGTILAPDHRWSELDTLSDLIRARTGDPPPQIFAYPDTCEAEANVAVRFAQYGDGRALAAILKRCSVSYSSSRSALLSILPMVKTGRTELARMLRYHRETLTTYSYNWIPFRFINDLLDYRELARFTGDVEEAQRLQQIIDRYSAMLADRRKLTAFLFWSI